MSEEELALLHKKLDYIAEMSILAAAASLDDTRVQSNYNRFKDEYKRIK